MHTIAWDQTWEVMKYWNEFWYTQFGFASPNNVMNLDSLALPCLMDPWSLRVNSNAYFSLLTHTKELLLLTFITIKCDTNQWTHGRTDRCEVWNSYLDMRTLVRKHEEYVFSCFFTKTKTLHDQFYSFSHIRLQEK